MNWLQKTLGVGGLLYSLVGCEKAEPYHLQMYHDPDGRVVSFDVRSKHKKEDFRFNIIGRCYKDGKLVSEDVPLHIGMNRIPRFEPYLVAHAIPWDMKDPDSIDRIVIEFRLGEAQSSKLPSHLEVEVTPDLFHRYWKDKDFWLAEYESDVRKRSKEMGIRSAR